MTYLQRRLEVGRFNLMQLRARGLPTKRISNMEKELDNMKQLVIMLRRDVQEANAQRDEFARALKFTLKA